MKTSLSILLFSLTCIFSPLTYAENPIEDPIELPIPIPLNVKVVSQPFESKIISSWMEVIKTDYSSNKMYVHKKIQYFINCSNKTYLYKSMYIFDKDGNLTKHIEDKIPIPISINSEYSTMPPDSIGEIFVNSSCDVATGVKKIPDKYTGWESFE